MDTLIPITITIADRSLRIKVEPSEEEAVRKSIKIINDKVLEFKHNFAGKDMQDYVTMALVWYATQPQGQLQNDLANNEWEAEIEKIDQQLDKALLAVSNFNKPSEN